MNKFAVLLIVNAFITIACSQQGPTPVPKNITDSYACADACLNLRKIGCEEANDVVTKKHCIADMQCDKLETCLHGTCTVTCEAFCVVMQNNGVWLAPRCLATIKSCKEIEVCPYVKQ